MKLIRFAVYLSLLLLTQCSSCKYDDPVPTLPAETQRGGYTFGCLVNGKPYVASGINYTNGDWQAVNSLAINAGARNQKEDFNICLVITGLLNSNTEYILQPRDTAYPATSATGFSVFCNTEQCEYEGTRIKNGSLMLTRFDGEARIAAGRFAFTLYEPGCDTLRITDGRFDVRF